MGFQGEFQTLQEDQEQIVLNETTFWLGNHANGNGDTKAMEIIHRVSPEVELEVLRETTLYEHV